MIVYSGTLKQFSSDVLMGIIADKIEECFMLNGFNHHNDAEYRTFNNSLMIMNNVLCNDSGIDKDKRVAIEYQIPLTSKRVDFLISGFDDYGKDAVVESTYIRQRTEVLLNGEKRIYPKVRTWDINVYDLCKKIVRSADAFLKNEVDDLSKLPTIQYNIGIPSIFLSNNNVK